MRDAASIIARLGLSPHPEGGHYRETFRASPDLQGRSAGTAILYLLQAGEVSHWHRVDASEIWHFHAGAPLELRFCAAEGDPVQLAVLGIDLDRRQVPQATVPGHWWQSANSTGEWTLVSCTVVPGFEFSGFELAPAGWQP
jgi:uncharacterized protein